MGNFLQYLPENNTLIQGILLSSICFIFNYFLLREIEKDDSNTPEDVKQKCRSITSKIAKLSLTVFLLCIVTLLLKYLNNYL